MFVTLVLVGCNDATAPMLPPGGALAPGSAASYEIYAHCGVEVLGNINSTWWIADAADGRANWIPKGWEADPDSPYGSLVAEVTLAADEHAITADYRGHSVTYLRAPAGFEPPFCD